MFPPSLKFNTLPKAAVALSSALALGACSFGGPEAEYEIVDGPNYDQFNVYATVTMSNGSDERRIRLHCTLDYMSITVITGDDELPELVQAPDVCDGPMLEENDTPDLLRFASEHLK